jgi:WS/DGAT/MGAT family acyltransferase
MRLNNVDLAWLRMDDPTNPMMITVVMHFEGKVDEDRLVNTLEVFLGKYRRFRQRIVIPDQPFRRPYWEDDPGYRVEDHLERRELKHPADEVALDDLINQKVNEPLDFKHPLWQLTMVDNYPAGSVLITRVHHCIADGISLMQILLQMTHTSARETANPSPQVSDGQGKASDGSSISRVGSTPSRSSRVALYSQPAFTEVLAAAVRIVFRKPDPPSLLKGPLGRRKKVLWSEPFPLPEIRKIARVKHATTNDLLMAIASGAVRRYLELHGEVRTRNLRSFVLVNLRTRAIDEELGNKFGLVFLTLPVAVEQPLERLGMVKQGMDQLKSSAEYAATYFILKVLGWMPEWIENIAIKIFDRKGTVVATNVPGPRNPLYLAGAPILSIMAAVPQSGRIGVGLSFISYNDEVIFGLNVDSGLVPDPEVFLHLFSEEFKCFQDAIA